MLTTIQKAAQIMNLLQKQGNLTLTEISRLTNNNHSSVYRLLQSLQEVGYVTKRGRRYDFSWQAIGDQQATHLLNWTTNAILTPVVKKYHLVAYVGIIQGGESVIADVVPRPGHAEEDMARLGERLPVNISALGKCAVAFTSSDDRQRLYNLLDFRGGTKHAISDLTAFRQSIRVIQKNGYAIDDEETQLGLRCVSVPLLDDRGKCVAVLALSGELADFPRTSFIKVRDDLLRCREQIMQEMN
ncbi:IclR family transcriptional regulator [Limosilactobacillus sp.]|jgi:DNA-binding IclR family transcriptional regulator|uniref:IclR family transcriptional regulator n=1 Tax=Limosilactobacillus sp. TaxID=2773925 RepID=UPI0025C42477|nr:IclR family transcriptional regulator C-terminal domain-containing protein [Limosilactobacillus sp.]